MQEFEGGKPEDRLQQGHLKAGQSSLPSSEKGDSAAAAHSFNETGVMGTPLEWCTYVLYFHTTLQGRGHIAGSQHWMQYRITGPGDIFHGVYAFELLPSLWNQTPPLPTQLVMEVLHTKDQSAGEWGRNR